MNTADHTFLFADLAGFTALTEAHGDEQAADLAEAFAQELAALAPSFSGEIVKAIGDAVMARFEAAAPAIDFGLTVIEKVGPRPSFPTVRVGLHTGPAVEREGDWFGRTVNVAARVSAQAAGSEVLLTGQAADAAGPMSSVELEKLGERYLRNVPESVTFYRAHRRGSHPTELDVDPVCQMAIPKGDEVGSLAHDGVLYHFCSLACAKLFAAAPQSYVPDAEQG